MLWKGEVNPPFTPNLGPHTETALFFFFSISARPRVISVTPIGQVTPWQVSQQLTFLSRELEEVWAPSD